MTIRDIEIELAYIRKNLIIRMVHSGKYTLQPRVIRNIDNGGNYYLSSFFNYIEALGFALQINNTLISDLSKLGIFLKSIRESSNLSIRDLKHPNRIGFREIYRLENGLGGSRDNLVEYIEMLNSHDVNLDFELIDKYGIKKHHESH